MNSNNNKYMRYLQFFPQQQNAMGCLHNIDFGVFWASWGGSGKKPGSGNRFRELVPGASSGNRIRVSMGSDRFCGSKVPVQKVAWKRFRRFRCLMGIESVLLYFESMLLHIESILLVLCKYTFLCWKYAFVLWKYHFVLRKYAFVRWKLKVSFCNLKVHSCTLKVYFENMLLYFDNMLSYFENMLLYFESMLL